MLDAFVTSNFAGQVIVVMLLIGSMFTWTVMVTKYLELRGSMRETKRFLLAYRNDPVPVALYLKRQKFAGSPLYPVYDKTCQALGGLLEASGANPSDLFMGGVSAQTRKITLRELEGLQNVAERTMADEALYLEKNMGILGTAVAVAPLMGLLGTVWGVMDSFGGISISGTATLSSVAPGIAGALLTTVVGLVVALPSTVAYNWLSGIIRSLTVQLENFSQEMAADMERTYVEKT
jgi:biopolymer transport protein TolQ